MLVQELLLLRRKGIAQLLQRSKKLRCERLVLARRETAKLCITLEISETLPQLT